MKNQAKVEFLHYVRDKEDKTRYGWRYLEMKERFEDIQIGYQQHQSRKWHCSKCDKQEELVEKDHIFQYNVVGQDKEIIVKNAPYMYCQSCKEYFGDLIIYAAVERILDQEVFYKLNNRHSLPHTIEMEFEEFLKPLE